MNDIPFIAFGNDELDEKSYIGEETICPNCKELHKVEYGDRVLEDGTKVPSKMGAFVKCNNGSVYLVGIEGKRI